MTLTTEEKRERRNAYMRQYRKGRNRSEEGKRYWQANKEKIMAKRREKPRTDKDREYYRDYAKRHADKYRAVSAAWVEKNRDKVRLRERNRHQNRLEAKAGKPRPDQCEICGQGGIIKFDHCHQTGRFRGWICNSCNVVLGYVKDDPDHLRKLISYLATTRA